MSTKKKLQYGYSRPAIRSAHIPHIVYVSYYGKLPGDPEILEGDQVTFYGKCSGRTSYDTPMGETKTIPWVVANYSSFNHFDDP